MELTNLPLIFSGISMVVAAASFWRTGKWRDSDEAKDLDQRVTAVESKVNEHSVMLDNVAKKADLAKIEGELKGLERSITVVASNVESIRDFLLEQKK